MGTSLFKNIFYFSDLVTYLKVKANLTSFVLSLLSGVLLFLAYPDFNYSGLVWIGLVPLFFAIHNRKFKEIYWLACTTGTVFVCGGFTWLPHVVNNFMEVPTPFDFLLWLLYGFTISQMFALIFLLFTKFQPTSNPGKILLFPGIVVTVWYFFPSIFIFQLSNGSTKILSALQGISLVGSDGLDFMISLSNITCYLLLNSLLRKERPPSALLIPFLMLLLWFIYGWFSLERWQEKIAGWDTKKIGLIQPNRTPSLVNQPPDRGYSYERPLELVMSEKLAYKSPELIIWPEGNLFGFFYKNRIRKSFREAINAMQIPIIFHDQLKERRGGKNFYRNSSVWIRKNGTLGGVYHKRKLVILGEYIPFFAQHEELSRRLGLPISISPGEKNEIFTISEMRITPAICYEIAFGQFMAEKIGHDGQGKIILVQSNDGWYGKGDEAMQHNTGAILRAVENRVPVIHSIYNGPSSIILPSGETQFRGDFWKRGKWVVEMPYNSNSGGSFYSQNHYLFTSFTHAFTLISILWIGYRKRRANNKRG